MKLTEARTRALKLIATYPGQVVAWQRGPRTAGYLQINGNIEQALSGSGLVEEVSTGIVLSTWVEDGEIITSYLNTWEITEAGRKAIGFPESTPTPEAKRESVSKGWEKFHAAAEVMNKRPGSRGGSDSLRNMLKF